MKDILGLFSIIFLFSCNDATKSNSSDIKNVVYQKHTFIKTDTLHFASDSSWMVVVGLQDAVIYVSTYRWM